MKIPENYKTFVNDSNNLIKSFQDAIAEKTNSIASSKSEASHRKITYTYYYIQRLHIGVCDVKNNEVMLIEMQVR